MFYFFKLGSGYSVISCIAFMPFSVLFPIKLKKQTNLPVISLRPSVLGSTPNNSFEGPGGEGASMPLFMVGLRNLGHF